MESEWQALHFDMAELSESPAYFGGRVRIIAQIPKILQSEDYNAFLLLTLFQRRE